MLALIDQLCPNRLHDENQHRDWHLATAMMRAYAARYRQEEFEVVALEKNFEGPIVNPSTGAASRSFVLAGKVDGIVRIGDDYFLLEHKTAAPIDADYLERLWTDFQIAIYSQYVEQALGHPDHRRHLQRPGKGAASARQGRNRGGIPMPARGAAREVKDRQDHGQTQAAGIR